MQQNIENYAFIDSQNLNLGVKSLGWSLDFKKFRVYLKDKCNVTKAFLFIGYLPENQRLYAKLQEDGYILIDMEQNPEFKLEGRLYKYGMDKL